MSQIPADLKYVSTHEWLRAEEGGDFQVGITDHAQDALGDLVFVELPEVGREVAAGEVCAVVESVKAASDIYAPIAGRIAAINTALVDHPEQVNQDCYGSGWLFRVTPADSVSLDALLDAEGYRAVLDQGG
ncbi:glycine cleavage system protein GcvH [Candidatus Macondimonas diazotrophica]|jgi:glycine cleavage system H protein|uniref:Glycine cleavage system H protein n=1 Tax=Candidatus Macondimonas diazotrophica TaxID=2305248 RepID=A0A4Z0FA81_9GAMM|nr:glycine cleavage system protein GcvH [Candidatus Macondimonas diazotrophica]NCU00871.1 glycine cleavage system protein GcvH [Candidatus Macondimonas diazotrophica]TFZ82535.1 glycine cleavage system protein GcvH [Candidatus Macondimonas diazotrophica]HBG29186.1 glycine cleavage system protein GcvH [Gammaproteobacteria bacterium]HBG52109.1 glycine cleavage system protein GcvH [Gammaproteobacteria bacterium]